MVLKWNIWDTLWLAESDHMTCVLVSDWLGVITWPGYWPLIGWEWSRDLDTDLWLILTRNVSGEFSEIRRPQVSSRGQTRECDQGGRGGARSSSHHRGQSRHQSFDLCKDCADMYLRFSDRKLVECFGGKDPYVSLSKILKPSKDLYYVLCQHQNDSEEIKLDANILVRPKSCDFFIKASL